MPHFVYVLESLRNGKRYVGMTSRNPGLRLREHNNGSNAWTRANRPLKLLFFEEYATRFEAAQRERFLKSGAGRKLRDQIAGDGS